jgi:hypothetical protein
MHGAQSRHLAAQFRFLGGVFGLRCVIKTTAKASLKDPQ